MVRLMVGGVGGGGVGEVLDEGVSRSATKSRKKTRQQGEEENIKRIKSTVKTICILSYYCDASRVFLFCLARFGFAKGGRRFTECRMRFSELQPSLRHRVVLLVVSAFPPLHCVLYQPIRITPHATGPRLGVYLEPATSPSARHGRSLSIT